MLKVLRRRLALLNALVTGALLLAMAFAALRVSERGIQEKCERDLRQFSASVVALASETAGSGNAIRLRLPGNYLAFVESADGAQLLIESEGGAEAGASAMSSIRRQVAERIDGGWTGDESAGKRDGEAGRWIMRSGALQSGDAAAALYAAPAHPQQSADTAALFAARPVFLRLTHYLLLLDDAHKPWRVSVTQVGEQYADAQAVDPSPNAAQAISQPASPAALIVVMQNRAEEIAARDAQRWLYFGCAACGLVLVGLSSLFLSARAIRPVEDSIRKQREFVAAASHELRTPVAAISANAEVLADAELGDFSPFLSAITQESGRMARLVTDLLDLARADADTLPVALTLVDAAGIAEQCLDALTPLAGGRTVTRRLTPAQIAADPARLRQALTALVDNAFRHTRADSRVEITVEPTPGYLSIRVADDGDGIPDAQKSRVFDRFYRLDTARSRAQGGCGLGLSIAREITERMNGQILLTDNVPTGCVFELRFPVAHGGHG